MDEDLVLRRIGEHIAVGRKRGVSARPGSPHQPAHDRQKGSGREAVPSGPQDPPGQQGNRGQAGPVDGRQALPAYDQGDPVVNLERQALKLAVQRPALLGPVFDAIGADAYSVPAHRAVRDLIAGCGGVATAGPVREWVDQLLRAAPNDVARTFLTRLAVEVMERGDGEPDIAYAERVLTDLEKLALSRQIAALKSRLQRMNPVTQQTEYARMFGDLIALEQRGKKLSEHADGP
jgi:DNA primase